MFQMHQMVRFKLLPLQLKYNHIKNDLKSIIYFLKT
ncbi:unknown [Bacteroides sp. CAG:598]|nr:unknown [Bacteroides sp. CAG:598]